MNPKRYYSARRSYYYGIDLHARSLYVCILDSQGVTKLSQNLPTTPEALLQSIQPYREGLVIGVELHQSFAVPDAAPVA